jgi:lysophosphatidic acid phosphatase type 6
MIVYSGHDSTLVPILAAMGVYTNDWPPYASFLTIDIAEEITSREKFVRVTFNDEDVFLPYADNQLWVPFNVFREKMEAYSISPATYKYECEQCNA